MKQATVLEIGKIKVVETTFDDIPQYNRICFEWVERSSYCMYPDEEVSIDIERDDAIKLIEVLQNHFKL